jgi:tetratricopeptide (TPR) repeat protein
MTATPEIHLQKAVQDGYLARNRGIYFFKHALFREAVMSSMLETRRQHYERRIGELFISLKKPAYEIAHHLTAGAMISDAAYYWIYAFNELYDRGLEAEAAKVIKTLTESTDDRIRLLGALLDAYQLTRVADLYDAECMFKELTKNPLVRKHALFGLCSLYDWSGRYPNMKKALIPLSRCRFTKVEEIDYLELKGIYYDMTGDDQRGLECYRRTMELAQRYGYKKSLMTSFHNIGWIHLKLHDFIKARRCFNKALTLVPDGDLYNEGTMLLRLGHIDNCEGNLTVARDHLLRSLKDFQRSAFPYWERLALWNLVDNCVMSGNRSQAHRFAQKADEISRSMNKAAEMILALHLYYGEHEKFTAAVKGIEKEEREYYYFHLYSLGKPRDAEEFLVNNNLMIKPPTPEQLKLSYGPLHIVSLYKKFVLPYKKLQRVST